MRPCDLLEYWLEGTLDQNDAGAFEEHLSTCAACEAQLADWSAIKTQFAQAVETAEDIRPPDALEASRFAAAVAARMGASLKAAPQKRRLHRYTVFSGIAAAMLLGILGWWLVSGESSDSGRQPAPPFSAVKVAAVGDTVRTGSGQKRVVSFASARVTVFRDSEVRFSQLSGSRATVTLVRGTVACRVDKRPAGSVFEVKAGAVIVTVVGTAFSVSILEGGGVRVLVDEGMVRVTHGKSVRNIGPGERLEVAGESAADYSEQPPATDIAQSSSARSTEKKRTETQRPADLNEPDVWRKLIVDGQLDEAESRIARYLAQAPDDQQARMTLAGVQRRQGKYRDAQISYDRVIDGGSAALANQARYLVGEIVQSSLGDHLGAIQYFSAYLEKAPPDATSRAEAGLHLAQSLLAVGRKAEARAQLQQIVDRYGHTPVAGRARRLLIENP